jgi:hypothetical protein
MTFAERRRGMAVPPAATIAERARAILLRTGYHDVTIIAERELRIPAQFGYDVAASVRAVAHILRLTVTVESDGTDTLVTFNRT